MKGFSASSFCFISCPTQCLSECGPNKTSRLKEVGFGWGGGGVGLVKAFIDEIRSEIEGETDRSQQKWTD